MRRIRKCSQGAIGNSAIALVVKQLGAEPPIEAYREFVPIQNRPFHPSAATLERNLGKTSQQRVTHTGAAPRRRNKQIFEIQAPAPAPSRVAVKKKRKTHRNLLSLGNETLKRRLSFPQLRREFVHRHLHCVWLALILRERTNEPMNGRGVGRCRETDAESCRGHNFL